MCPSPIPLPAPLCSTPVTALRCSYGRSDSCAGGSSARREHEHRPHLPRRSPCVMCRALVIIPSPHTGHLLPSLSHATPQRRQSPAAPRRSDFAFIEQAHRDGRPNRVRLLRTNDSPLVALHPVSRQRSYQWLQAGERLPEEDFDLSDAAHLQAHSTASRSDARGRIGPDNTNIGIVFCSCCPIRSVRVSRPA
jgi:hypothetical protein